MTSFGHLFEDGWSRNGVNVGNVAGVSVPAPVHDTSYHVFVMLSNCLWSTVILLVDDNGISLICPCVVCSLVH